MPRDQRLDRGKLDFVVFADSLDRKITRQGYPATRALAGVMINDAIRVLTHRTAATFMTKLGAAGLCLVPTLLAITRGRLGRCARRLPWPLHPQHQIDQFFLRQTLQITSIHAPRDSEIPPPDKGWVIT